MAGVLLRLRADEAYALLFRPFRNYFQINLSKRESIGKPSCVHGRSQRRALNRGAVEQLRAVLGQVQVQPLSLKVVAEALVFLAAEQILQQPIPLAQSLDGQHDKTLAAMRGQVHDDQIKAIRLSLPLNDDKIFRSGVFRPGRTRPEDFPFASSDGRATKR